MKYKKIAKKIKKLSPKFEYVCISEKDKNLGLICIIYEKTIPDSYYTDFEICEKIQIKTSSSILDVEILLVCENSGISLKDSVINDFDLQKITDILQYDLFEIEEFKC